MTRQEFCSDLKSARIYQKITLEQIAQETRIQLDYLRALEEGDWEQVPFAYLKGYLGNYADMVGMNIDRVMDSFAELNYQPEKSGPKTNDDLPSYANFGSASAGRRIPSLWESIPALRYLLLAGAGVIILLLVLGVWWSYRWWHTTRQKPVDLQPVHIVPESTIDTLSDQIIEGLDTAAIELQAFRVDLIFSDSCYLRLKEGDRLLTEKIFLSGDSAGWESTDELTLTVGNPAVTRLLLNGKPAETLGAGRRPAHLTINASGIQKTELRGNQSPLPQN